MGISQKDLTVVIVTFQSEKVINDCINSIDKNLFEKEWFLSFLNSLSIKAKCIRNNDNLSLNVSLLSIKSLYRDLLVVNLTKLL